MLKRLTLMFVLASTPVFSNGGDFFNELSESWSSNVDTGTPFFGVVRDVDGKAIPRAIVAATVNDNTVVILADNLGHFRIPGLGKEIETKNVSFNCSKAGYVLKSLDRRQLRSVAKAPIEVNCKLSKV